MLPCTAARPNPASRSKAGSPIAFYLPDQDSAEDAAIMANCKRPGHPAAEWNNSGLIDHDGESQGRAVKSGEPGLRLGEG